MFASYINLSTASNKPHGHGLNVYKASLTIGFKISNADSSLFILHVKTDIILLLVYVDDVIITRRNTKHIARIIKTLSTKFALKDDLGLLSYFFTGQIHSILAHKTHMEESSTMATPIAMKEASSLDDDKLANATEYRQTVGSLQYLTFTRPDIKHTVNKACQSC